VELFNSDSSNMSSDMKKLVRARSEMQPQERSAEARGSSEVLSTRSEAVSAVDSITEFLRKWSATEIELMAVVERTNAELAKVRREMATMRSTLDAIANEPVIGGEDPTEWLPDELIEDILLMLPPQDLWMCVRVCQRWARLARNAPVNKRRQEARWDAYAVGLIKPRAITGHVSHVRGLAVGPDGRV